MASKAAQAAKQRVPTEAENRAKKRALELLGDDAKRVHGLGIHQPFGSLQDAVERLLPFHVFGAMDAGDLDAEEAAAMEDATLLASRRDVNAEQAMQTAVEACTTVENMQKRIAAFKEQYDQRHQKLLPEEELRVQKLMEEEMQRALTAERLKTANNDLTSSEEEESEEEDEAMDEVQKSGGGAPGKP